MNIDSAGAGEHLQRQYGLRVLRISLDASGDRPQALLSLTDRNGEEVALLTAPLTEFGLPDERELAGRSPDEDEACVTGRRDLPEEEFRLPDYVRGALRAAVESAEPEGAPLWISLIRPTGMLVAVPWERLLNPVVRVPVLRLPCQLIAPRAPRHELNSVVCFSSPVATPAQHQDLIDQFVAQVPQGLAKLTRLHLFADAVVYDRLLAIKAEHDGVFKIEVYKPPTPTGRSWGRQPWLTWIREAMTGVSADVVHFLCHCYRVREQGALALAEAPDRTPEQTPTHIDTTQASLLFAPDLVEFLDAMGAWSVAFSSPPTNMTMVGMRMLQDQIARLRPGPIFLHDMAHPEAREALRDTYGFLYGAGCDPPDSGAVSLVAHPFRSVGSYTDETSERLLNEYTLAGRLGERLSQPGQPSWLAASQRILEATAADAALPLEVDEVAESGRKRGRNLVLEALAEYAVRGDDDDRADSGSESASEAGSDSASDSRADSASGSDSRSRSGSGTEEAS